MVPFVRRLFYDAQDRQFARSVRQITGFPPSNLTLYRLATRHVSVAKTNVHGVRESNERLEYLGDAVLGVVVAEHLFKKFPFKDEGFLTEIRSRIVNRESLNQLARKTGIADLIEFDDARKAKVGRGQSHKSIGGNTLEALVGAVYLDQGFRKAGQFILKKLLSSHVDLSSIVENDTNYKSKVIEWAQKHNRAVRYEIVETRGGSQYKEFITQLLLDDKPISTGSGYSKKKSEQRASENALSVLDTHRQ